MEISIIVLIVLIVNAVLCTTNEMRHRRGKRQSVNCGSPIRKHHNAGIISRIFGGEILPYEHSPWMISVEENGYHKCGATLIGEKWAVTAAHCLYISTMNPNKVFEHKLIAGEYSKQLTDDHEQIRYSIRNILHPRFNPKYLFNDLALMEADQTFDFNNFVMPACLPEQNEQPFPFTICEVSGWGFMNPSTKADFLQTVKLPVLPQSACEHAYPAKRGFHPIRPRVLCAGLIEGKKDHCNGDSGGPMICPGQGSNMGSFVLTGVVSWAKGCAERRKPGVYTRIEPYVKWIKHNSGRRPRFNRDPCKYTGITLHPTTSGVVKTPGYDPRKKGTYPRYSLCTWTLDFSDESPGSSYLSLLFDDLDIKGGTGCKMETVKIYTDNDWYSPIGVYCGSVVPADIITPLPAKIKIVLKTDLTVSGRGFKLAYAIKSGMKIVSDDGMKQPPLPSP